MENIKKFLHEYRGAIIGALIAIVIICTHLYRLIMGIILLAIGIFLGNYIQQNKNDVKEKIINFVNKL